MDAAYPYARFLVIGLAAAVVTVLGAAFARARPDRRGWRQVRAGGMHWVGLGLAGGLTCLMTYVWLFVGSSRPDGAQQMRVLFWLIVTFGACTLLAALIVRAISVRGVHWRGQSLAYATSKGTTVRDFREIARLRATLWGRVDIHFSDGAFVWLDPNATGALELIDAINEHLEARVGNAGP